MLGAASVIVDDAGRVLLVKHGYGPGGKNANEALIKYQQSGGEYL